MRRFSLNLLILVLGTSLACRPEVNTVENGERAGPVLIARPADVAAGDQVELEARDFPGGMAVVVGFGLPNSEYDVLEEGHADDDGHYATSVSVPTWATPGQEYVWVVAGPRNRPLAVSDPFTVRLDARTNTDTITITGVITDEGVECLAMRDDAGRLYTLAGAPAWATPGLRVEVRGTAAEMSFCQQGTTISVESIDRK